ncbi:hypothetical protein D3C81_1133680 [compost metagenome]
MAAPDQRAGARFQLSQGEGLGEVVVGAEVQAAHAVFHGTMRSQDQHRHRVAPLAQAPQHFQAVQAGQADIEDGQRVVLRGEQVVGARAVVHAIDREAALAEGFHEGGGQFQVVFGKQDTHGRVTTGTAGERRERQQRVSDTGKRRVGLARESPNPRPRNGPNLKDFRKRSESVPPIPFAPFTHKKDTGDRHETEGMVRCRNGLRRHERCGGTVQRHAVRHRGFGRGVPQPRGAGRWFGGQGDLGRQKYLALGPARHRGPGRRPEGRVPAGERHRPRHRQAGHRQHAVRPPRHRGPAEQVGPPAAGPRLHHDLRFHAAVRPDGLRAELLVGHLVHGVGRAQGRHVLARHQCGPL